MGRNSVGNALTACKLSAAALALSCIWACSTNTSLSDGSKASPGTGTDISSTESSVSPDDGENPAASPAPIRGIDWAINGRSKTYIDGQSQMRSPSERLPDVGSSTSASASDRKESPLVSKRHYPFPNYADPSSDAGVLPYTPHDVSSSPGYFAATTIPAPSGSSSCSAQ
jgi:hypothetical protein